MDRQHWARPEDMHRATAARIYDALLGGHHNFPEDRQAAELITQLWPATPALAKANRAFLARIVHSLTARGIRQLLDLGSGIPTVGNVHQIAHQTAPDTRVVYVDIDPVAVLESRNLLTDTPHATALHGDIRHPDQLLDQPELRRLIDLTQPVGLLLVSVLHFCPDPDAQDAVAHLRDALPAGSYLAISHLTSTPSTAPIETAATQIYQQATATPLHIRTPEQILAFFGDYQLLPPGLVPPAEWHDQHTPTDPDTDPRLGQLERQAGLGGLALKTR